jgi:hypothetical protein
VTPTAISPEVIVTPTAIVIATLLTLGHFVPSYELPPFQSLLRPGSESIGHPWAGMGEAGCAQRLVHNAAGRFLAPVGG